MDTVDQLFDETIREIKQFYRDHPELMWGWRFLHGPKSSLKQSNGLITLGLNPGGEEETTEPHRPEGNIYRDPEWSGDGPVYARQVHALFRLIHRNIETPLDPGPFMDHTVTSNLVPFRAPGFDQIEPRQAVLQFGRSLWRQWLEVLSPDVILAIGNGESNPSPFRALKRIMSENRSLENVDHHTVWSNYSIKTCHSNRGETIIGLPHLSRCQFMTSDKGEPVRDFLVKQLNSTDSNLP